VHLGLHDRHSESFKPTSDLFGLKDCLCSLHLCSEDKARCITSDGLGISDLVVILTLLYMFIGQGGSLRPDVRSQKYSHPSVRAPRKLYSYPWCYQLEIYASIVLNSESSEWLLVQLVGMTTRTNLSAPNLRTVYRAFIIAHGRNSTARRPVNDLESVRDRFHVEKWHPPLRNEIIDRLTCVDRSVVCGNNV
jgi:hypothetical protein